MLDMRTNEPRPEYYVMQLYSSNIGSRIVAHTASNDRIRTLATRANGRTVLFVVNKSLEPDGMDASIQLQAESARAVSLAGTSEAVAEFERRHPSVERNGEYFSGSSGFNESK